jgi:hypothetical protein
VPSHCSSCAAPSPGAAAAATAAAAARGRLPGRASQANATGQLELTLLTTTRLLACPPGRQLPRDSTPQLSATSACAPLPALVAAARSPPGQRGSWATAPQLKPAQLRHASCCWSTASAAGSSAPPPRPPAGSTPVATTVRQSTAPPPPGTRTGSCTL